MIKYALVGTPQFAADIGERLLADGYQPAFVLTRADKPAGRGQKVVPSPMRSLALRHSVPCLLAEQPGELHPDRIRNYDVQLLIVIAFGFVPATDPFETSALRQSASFFVAALARRGTD